MNKTRKKILFAVGVLVMSIFLYYSPLNYRTIDDFTADNIEEKSLVPFSLTRFAVYSDDWNKDRFDKDHFTLFGDFNSVNVGYKRKYENYNSEFEIVFDKEGNYYGKDYDFQMTFSSNKKNIRFRGMYMDGNEIPSIVVFRHYPWKWYSGKYSGLNKNGGFKSYDQYYEQYANTLFNNFKEKGFTLKRTNLKDGKDILIKKQGNYFLVVTKHKSINNNSINALEFKVYNEKLINIL
jgi:hypothetical protein